MSNETLYEIGLTRDIKNTVPISEDCNLTTFLPDVSKDLCDEFGIDYISALENTKNIKSLDKPREFKNVNIAISAAVNSYGRIYMGKIKLYLLSKGYKLYYTDTDNLVTDKPLDDSFIGSALGLFKLEHTIKRGYFISSKLYCLVKHDDKLFI